VLEYVNGERIDAWCNRNRLTLAARIALFITVCKAVAHAHENLIVHRDLKPSNIFVTADGEVKLLDFGVAKLLADEGSDLTREAGAAMTPVYAAPEQIAGSAVSTATDVYGLGMVLYELLNGVRLPERTGNTALIAKERSTSVQELRKALRGDVAVVVAKAVKANPEERYHSAQELADELQRVLERRPIRARPDTLWYRAGKYAQRHALGLSMALAVVLVLIAGVTGTVVNARAAAREGERAVAVKRFLLDLFEQARGSVRGGVAARAATLDDVLSAGAQRVDTAFAAQPDIRDEVFQILIELYTDTGTREQIEGLARKRVAAAKAAFGPNDERTAPSEVMLAAVLINFGVYDEARALLDHAQRLLDNANDSTSIERARLLRWQGILTLATHPSIPWNQHPLRRSVELMRDRYADSDDLLAALTDLPTVACHYGLPGEAMASADELYRRTLARYGTGNLFVTEAIAQRARILQLTNRARDAVPLFEEAMDGLHKYVGEDSPNVVAVLSHLAETYQALGRTADAERTLDAARAATDRHPGDARLAALLAHSQQDIEQIKAGHSLHCGP
jgi:serine/threonine-protein kinase